MASLYDELLEKAFDEAVKKTVEKLFSDRWGYGDDGAKVVTAIREEATKMLREDPEVRGRLKARIMEIIERGESRK